jgi:hypothetical protein
MKLLKLRIHIEITTGLLQEIKENSYRISYTHWKTINSLEKGIACMLRKKKDN